MAVELTTLQIEARLVGIEKAVSGLKDMAESGKGAEQSMGSLALKIAGYTSIMDIGVRAGQAMLRGIKDLAVESVVLAAGFEKSRMTWGVLVGDMELGKKVFEDIRKFSAETPLSFEGLNSAATTLKGFGVATDHLIPTLSKLGDVAMGDNAKLGQLSLVYGQVMAQGKAKTQDLYQFINAGVPIFNMLADSMGKASGEIKDLAADGAITFEEIEKAITKATSAGGQFYDLMDKTAETTSGKWSTAVDNWEQSLARLGETALPTLTKALEAFNTAVNKVADNSEYAAFLKNPTGFQGDLDAVSRVLQEQIKLNEKNWSINQGFMRDYLAGIQAQVEARRKLENYRDPFLNATGPKVVQGEQRQSWQYWEKAIDDEVAAELRKVDEKAKAAELLGRSYDKIKERDAVLDKAIDRLLALTGAQTSEVFLPSDRSIQELANQKSKPEVATPAAAAEKELPISSINDYIGSLLTLQKYTGPAVIGLTELGWAAADADTKFAEFAEDTSAADEVIARFADKEAGLRQEMAMVNQLFATGKIDVGTYVRAMAELEEQIANLDPAMVAFRQSMAEIGQSLAGIAQQGAIDIFESIGASMVSGAEGADSFEQAIQRAAESILNNLPLMLLQAGLNAMVTPGMFYVGLGLVAASGLVAIGAGAYNASTQDNALGGVYDSRSLSSYSGGVYDTPQLFNFARGGAIGRFGEAGPEAIMPLKRTPSGALGVAASGGSNVSVVVNNNGSNTVANTEETTDADGVRQIVVTVENIVRAGMANGKFDSAMSRYGSRPRGVRT